MHTECSLKVLAAAALFGLAGMAAAADGDRLRTNVRYDQEYPVIAYSGPATHNRVWRLQQRLESGELKLVWDPRFGYLRSLLQALDINPDSQVLVFSRTSLQVEHIDAHTPRAVYFNDDTYIGYVQNSSLVEVTAIDSEKGPVFYAFDNQENGTPTHMEREGGRCLTCHDTFSMTGGGVPRVMVMSAPVDDKADIRTYTAADETDDRTPLAWAVHKTLAEVRERGAEVAFTALRRRGITGREPEAATILKGGDVLVVYGQPQAIEHAEAILLAV